MINASTVLRELADLIDDRYKLARMADPGYTSLMEGIRWARWYAREKLGAEIAPGFGDELLHMSYSTPGKEQRRKRGIIPS